MDFPNVPRSNTEKRHEMALCELESIYPRHILFVFDRFPKRRRVLWPIFASCEAGAKVLALEPAPPNFRYLLWNLRVRRVRGGESMGNESTL